ncbi:MAG: heavy metal translocating P-type ATPase [Anaerolineae bacterium]
MTTTRQITLPIIGLDCMDCARTLEGGLAQLGGVQRAELNFSTANFTVQYDAQQVSPVDIIARIRELGYDVALGDELVFQLEGLDCADCAAKLEQAIAALPNVIGARVNFATAQMHVRGIASQDLPQMIAQRANELGYAARLPSPVAGQPKAAQRTWRDYLLQRARLVLTAASGLFWLTAIVLHLAGAAAPVAIVAYALAILSGGYYVAKSGWAAFRTTHSLDMNALMSIAAIGAMAIGEWAEGATAIFLFSLGNTLESLTMDRARQAIRKLVELSPKEATRVHGDHRDRVLVEQLQVGDLIEVKPGERVPMDGVIESGVSTLNQAPITGEAAPVDARPGSPVYAGSINGNGALLIRVTKIARDNTLARIVQMVQEAQTRRAPAQRFVDTFAKYYTPAVIVLAAAIAIVPPLAFHAPFFTWFYRALVLLVIACPCALVISTPVAIVSAISNAAHHGVLIKGGMYLEALGHIRAVAFDKTGTLTEGKLAVMNVEPVNAQTAPNTAVSPSATNSNPIADDILALAASIEAHSQHPVGQAIYEEARQRRLVLTSVADYQELTGLGGQARINGQTYYIGSHSLFCARVPHAEQICQRVNELEAEGKTAVLVGTEDNVLGIIAVADRVREVSAEVVRKLHLLGIERIVLLSGDNERTAQAIAKTVGIHQVQANLLPQDKVQAVERLLTEHGSVAMVGDGVNDAPAMARATVGIAMGAAGSDAALETADIVLMSDDLQRIPYVIRLGRRTMQNIQQNIALSLLIKGLFLALSLVGLATLWMAVFADVGTSLIVTFNGLRLLRDSG